MRERKPGTGATLVIPRRENRNTRGIKEKKENKKNRDEEYMESGGIKQYD